MKYNILAVSVLVGLIAVGCVSAKKYKELESNFNTLINENFELKGSLQSAETNIQDLGTNVASLRQEVALLKVDTARMGNQIRSLTAELASNNKLLSSRDRETRDILARLKSREEEIIAKEENLRRLMLDFEDKEARVRELESILEQQKDDVNQLRNAVSSALFGFENNGLTIEIRNGKVYVSLEESLLFASGSTTVDRRGQTALIELAKVLEVNTEINIMIEGHTDDVPLRSGGAIRDNWDLSVLRATAIVRILTSGSRIDPQRFIVAGRGEYMPIDNSRTPEARRRNRRTEIILTPKLDALLQMLDMN